MIQHVCDRCDRTGQPLADAARPGGWSRLTIDRSDKQPKTIDICGSCTMDALRFMEPLPEQASSA